ncbi:MAG TPA: ATP-binding protein [Rhodocyclaceae bacterium]|nr:ATP-binding protein [Rhodocyclaceae bacterium]
MATSPPPTLDDAVLRTLAQRGLVRTYPRHTVLISEGDRSDALFIILDGKVKVFVGDAHGREVVLGVQGPGEYFGEMALDAGPRSASVMTLEKSRLVIVPGDTLDRFLAEHPDFALHLIHTLIHRVRTLTDSVRSLALLDVYGRVARLLLERARRQRIELALALDARVATIRADELKEIVLNLLANALKFTPAGGRVTLGAEAAEQTVRITVRDTGIGIAPAQQAAIFEAFHQIADDPQRAREGTGLGLTLARRFVELHGGTIDVASEPGHGATFTVTLPVDAGTAAAARAA